MNEEKPAATPTTSGGGMSLPPGMRVTMIDSSISNNVGVGIQTTGDTQIDLVRSSVDGNLGGGIVLEEPKQPQQRNGDQGRHWYSHPIWGHQLTKTIFAVVAIVCGAGIAFWLGWK